MLDLELLNSKNYFNLANIFVLRLFKMAAYQTKWFRLEQRSVIKFLVTEKCKPCESYRRMCDVRGAFNKFPAFFVQAFKIVVNSWKFSMLLLYILWDDWQIFMISASKEQLQQQLEYTLLKPDCHSWWISKMQSGREDTLEEWYAIKLCFKLGKNATETYGML